MKTCTKCENDLPLTEFYTSHGKPYPACKTCHNERQRLYREANREKINARARELYSQRTYGVSEQMLADVRQIQGGVCAICEEREPEWIDHDHATGLVRGLLCKPCNWALGHLKDDPVIIRRALMYVQYYMSVQDPEIDQIHAALSKAISDERPPIPSARKLPEPESLISDG